MESSLSKMQFRINIIFCILFLSHIFSLATIYGQESRAKYSKVRIQITGKQDILSLKEAGLVFDHIDFQETYFDAVLNDWEVELLRKISPSYEILVDDLEAEYHRRPKLTQADLSALEAQMKRKYGIQGFNFGSMGGYYTFNEVVAELDEMRAFAPNLISVKQSIGITIEGRDIWMVKISDNPDIKESEEEILYTALTHAREPQSMATVIYFMWHLLENYGSDSVVDFLVNNRELYFIPVINADGYVHNESTNPNGGGNWRKNRRDNGGGIFGVDPNRNYGFQWGFNNSGSSPTPSSSTYRGTGPFSEPETQTIRDFVNAHNFTMAFNYHSFSNVLIFPYDYQINLFTPDHALFLSVSQNMTLFNNYPFGTTNQTLGGTVNGVAVDWFYGEQTTKNKIIALTPEVGSSADGFWPNQNRIIPLAVDNLYSNLVLANGLGGGMPPIVDITITPQTPTTIPPGGAFLIFDLDLQNNTNTDWSVNYWNSVTIPIGEEVGPVGGFPIPTINLAPGASFSTTLSLEIPAGVPPATYDFNWKTGIFTNGSVDVDSFSFTKTPGPIPAGKRTLSNTEGWESILQAEELVPQEFVLGQNYPNPFKPSTTISYQLPTQENVSLVIYDLTGRQVRELVNERQETGSYTARWDGRNQTGQKVATGLYVYQIRAGQFNQTRKMLCMK